MKAWLLAGRSISPSPASITITPLSPFMEASCVRGRKGHTGRTHGPGCVGGSCHSGATGTLVAAPLCPFKPPPVTHRGSGLDQPTSTRDGAGRLRPRCMRATGNLASCGGRARESHGRAQAGGTMGRRRDHVKMKDVSVCKALQVVGQWSEEIDLEASRLTSWSDLTSRELR